LQISIQWAVAFILPSPPIIYKTHGSRGTWN